MLIYHPKQMLSCLIVLFAPLFVKAQDVDAEEQDSIFAITVPIAEIPTAMVQTRIKTIKLLDDNIQPEDLKTKDAQNDSVLNIVKKDLNKIKESARETQSTRYLENRELQLKVQKNNVTKLSAEFSALINDLDNAATYFRGEKKTWNATKTELDKNNYGAELLSHIDKLDVLLDSAQTQVSDRTESIFTILEKNANIIIEIEDLLEQIKEKSSDLESKILEVDRPSIFKLDYSPENTTFKKDAIIYIRGIYTDLKSYFQTRKNGLYILLILFIIIVYLCLRNKEKLSDLEKYGKSYYQRKLGEILTEPINAATLLVLVISTIIFRQRPLAFRDVFGFLIIIPLLRVMLQVLDKKFHKYISWAALLTFPILLYVIFPPENIFFRFNLILLAVGELFITVHLFWNVRKMHNNKHKMNKKLILPASFIYLIFSIIGLVAGIIGNVLLAQIVLFTTYYSIIGGAVLYATSIMINGSILTFLNSEKTNKINAITKYRDILSKRLVHLINFLLFFNWILILSAQLKIKHPIVDAVLKFMQQERTLGAVTFNFNEILIFILVIYISTFIAKIIQVLLEDDILNKVTMEEGVSHSIAVMVRYAIITIGVMLAVSSAGLSMSNLTVILGAFGVGIGFGLQNIFNNLVSGLILLFERPVKIGDTVEVGDIVGKVNHIGIRSSNIRTFDGSEVIVPNGNLISSELVNWTLSDSQRRIEIIVGVSYDSKPDQVIEILKNILSEHTLILKQPGHSVYFQELGDSALNFRMLFWVYSYNEWLQIKSEIITRVFNDLSDHGIEIPFPQRDIHIRSFEEQLKVKHSNTPSSDKKNTKKTSKKNKSKEKSTAKHLKEIQADKDAKDSSESGDTE